MTHETKEKIELHLLKSMDELDHAMYEISKLQTLEDKKNAGTLNHCKNNIKQVLNRHYDRLARRRNTKK